MGVQYRRIAAPSAMDVSWTGPRFLYLFRLLDSPCQYPATPPHKVSKLSRHDTLIFMLMRSSNLLSLLFFLLSTKVVDADFCVNQLGGVRARESDTCFFSPNERGTWHDAEEECRKRNAVLASVHSTDENDALKQLWRSIGADEDQNGLGGIWIGLNDQASEGTYEWIDGSTVNFLDWKSVRGVVQPNNWNEQDCTSFGYNAADLDVPVDGWVDNPCEMQQRFVCAVDRCTSPDCYPQLASAMGVGGNIADRDTTDFPLDVSTNVDGVLSVEIRGLEHGYAPELYFALIDPSGRSYKLLSTSTGTPYSGQTYKIIEGGGSSWPSWGHAPPTGTYNRVTSNSYGWDNVALDKISGPAGVWKLRVVDNYLDDIGRLQGWSLEYFVVPDEPYKLVSGSGGQIADRATTDFPLDVSTNVYGVLSVEIRGLEHGYAPELYFALIDPSGRSYKLLSTSTGTPYSGQTYKIVEGGGSSWPSWGHAPPAGTYNRVTSNSYGWDNVALDKISGPAGVWKLHVVDNYLGDIGRLQGWSLEYNQIGVFQDPALDEFRWQAVETVTLALSNDQGDGLRMCEGAFVRDGRILNGRDLFVHDGAAPACFIGWNGARWSLSSADWLEDILAVPDQGPFVSFNSVPTGDSEDVFNYFFGFDLAAFQISLGF